MTAKNFFFISVKVENHQGRRLCSTLIEMMNLKLGVGRKVPNSNAGYKTSYFSAVSKFDERKNYLDIWC